MELKEIKIIRESIDKLYVQIESVFNNTNEILLLNYTYCIFDTELKDVQSFYWHRKSKYAQLLINYITEIENNVRKPEAALELQYRSLPTNDLPDTNKTFGFYSRPAKAGIKDVCSLNTWPDYCEQHEFGGFVMSVFYRMLENVTISIYLVLSKRLNLDFSIYNKFECINKELSVNEANSFLNLEQFYQLRDLIKDFLLTDGWKAFYQILNKKNLVYIAERDILQIKIKESIYADEFIKRATAQKHTIFNILANTQRFFFNAKEYINDGNIKKALISLDKGNRNFKLLELCNRAIYNYDKDEGSILYDEKKQRWKTIVEMILLLEEIHTVDDVKPQLPSKASLDRVLNSSQNYSPPLEIISLAFITIWNLWSNAIKNTASGKAFDVNIYTDSTGLFLSFGNFIVDGREKDAKDAIAYLTDIHETPVKLNGGLWITKDLMEHKLNWKIVKKDTRLMENYFLVTIDLTFNL